jgi:beta-aspartyl-peptidase (threonine type)
MKPVILVHGGAGTILRTEMDAEKESAYRMALSDALETGYRILERGGKAIDAVEAAVIYLQHFTIFNAGYGTVF